MKKIVKRVFSATGFVFIAVLLLAIFYLIFMKASGRVPKFFGYSIFTVISGSMEPTIPVGEYILVRDVSDMQSLQEGDVIVFYSKDPAIYGQPNTHRIVSIMQTPADPVFTTKGDANATTDKVLVTASDVIGVYVCSLPFLAAIGNFLKNPLVFLLLIVLPAAAMFIAEAVHLFRQARKNKKEKQMQSAVEALKEKMRDEDKEDK